MGWRYLSSAYGYFVPLVHTIWHPLNAAQQSANPVALEYLWGGVVMTRPNRRHHIANQRRAESQQ